MPFCCKPLLGISCIAITGRQVPLQPEVAACPHCFIQSAEELSNDHESMYDGSDSDDSDRPRLWFPVSDSDGSDEIHRRSRSRSRRR